MTVFKPLLLICSLALSGAALAEDASVMISSPADGAKVSASAPTTVTYEVVPGPKGDHVHLYVDNGEAKVLRQLKGTTTVDALKAGRTRFASRSSTRVTRRSAWKSASKSRPVKAGSAGRG